LLCFYPEAKTETILCELLHDISLLKWTKCQQSVYDNGSSVYILKCLCYLSVGRYGKIW